MHYNMKTLNIYVTLIILFSSCQTYLDKEKEKYCEYVKQRAKTEIQKGNIELALKGKHLYSETERYFIWRKYGVNIFYPIDLNEFYQIELDSCYITVMLEHTPNYKDIIMDLDSLTALRNNNGFEYPKSKYIRQYHDGKFYIGFNANNMEFAPKRIDTTYNDKLKEFQEKYNSELTDTIRCEFWYVIDTTGTVSDIEIYHHSTPLIDLAVIEFYSSFMFEPANDGETKIEFRDNDFIYFLGTMKK
jgi:hypothetical protein